MTDKSKKSKKLKTQYGSVRYSNFINKVIQLYGCQYTYGEYINMTTRMMIICNQCQDVMYETPKNHLHQKAICQKCHKIPDKPKKYLINTKQKYLEQFAKIYGEKFDFSQFDYQGYYEDAEIICNNCKQKQTFTIRKLLNGTKCSFCVE
ncbi:hypothetical protein [Acanthamoeba polyphaga mimivirus]|uniref:Uncharacterized protein n=1 Tax=Acanthamoeba polyphaga mimivirus TaxID=212035 RepID=A0A0G2Y8J5_MIMIV|nr:hypothetical protein [Acanthamoeba castellanii mamavirus]AKI79451.1 hypothetical protein [Acanthamoeba polyphaga mimivirus]UMZ07789.1 hypothetical protein [Acanthamoeba polyphaga mimivirus]